MSVRKRAGAIGRIERERDSEKARRGRRDEERLPNKAKSPSHKTRPPRGCTQNPNPSTEMGQQPCAETRGFMFSSCFVVINTQ